MKISAVVVFTRHDDARRQNAVDNPPHQNLSQYLAVFFQKRANRVIVMHFVEYGQ